jgi:hypothetical protein
MDDNERVGEDHRQRALTKLRLELKKDISRAELIAANCGLWELLRLCYLLRVSRTYAMHPRLQGTFTKAQISEFHLHDEAVKYAIGLVAKHGSWAGVCDLQNSFNRFNNGLVNELMRHTRHINSKFDTEKLLHIAHLRVIGDRDQDAILDMNLEKLEPKRAMYLHYGLRIEHFTSRSKECFKSIPELVAQVRKDVAGLEEQFAEMFGLSLDRYCEGLSELKSMFEAKLQAAIERIDPQNTGSIDFDQVKSFVELAGAMYFTDSELDASVSADFAAYLRSQPFVPGNSQGDELRFHYLTRRPFLVGRGFAVLSPDLCFDSIVDNIRFTLLESSGSKHAYKAAASAKFLDQVAEIAKPYGYVDVAREVDLKQGKKGLGDIDLVLFNASTHHTLLVEGKNHALPLAVYFCSPEAVDDHVTRNQDWEKKVKGRIEHFKSGSSSYEVSGDWDYIVVSRMPEPLAHHTDLLVLCLDEFKQWIAQTPLESTFKEFYQRTYQPNQPNMTMAEMKDLTEKGYSLLRTEP